MAVRIETHAEPIPGYRLIERIGGGGFGDVWKCEAPGGLHKAIKFVFGDLGAAGDDGHRAEQELKALSRVKTVRHPYILSLERYDILDGQLMIVMELADRNLWDRFKECRARGLPGIPREELLCYMEETAEALDLMNNEYQLQHLDIKPQNLFLVHQHIKVADFGLVKDLEGMQASVTGGVTPVYAAPETFDGWVSRYCDQYSLAIVFQELLTGQRPFLGNNIHQLILQHLQAAPNLTSLPPSDQAAIARALSKTPGDRFPTCRALVENLRGGEMLSVSLGEQPTVTESGPTPDPLSPSQIAGLTAAGGITNFGKTASPLDDSEPMTACLRPNRGSETNLLNSQFVVQSSSYAPAAGLAELRKAPPEINDNGVLFPSLVLGVGQLGMTVVQALRRRLHQRFGGMERLPHLRLMVLDTDPEVVRAVTRGSPGSRLSENEVVLAPLNRPSHYLKPRDGRPNVEGWLNSRMLYRIPRSQMTTGVRALGRLAFCDNYRLIRRRLITELSACMNPEALETTAKQTGLGIRTNRVRVYVVASLAGGTGSGMFLDLAYNVRALLKLAGYEQPDVVGLLLLPPVDRNRTRTLTLGNTCAALRELSHFATPGTVFRAQYHQREAPLQDADPPFGRCILLPLPDETDEQATRQMVEQAGLFLSRDLCSGLGRAADLGRGGLTGTSWESRGLFYQTFGLYQVSLPRHALLDSMARRMCQRLIQRWMSKDSKPIQESVRDWVREQWTRQELGSSVLMERLAEGSRQALGEDPDELFRNLVEPLLEQSGGPSPEQLAELITQFEQLLGKPEEDGLTEEPARMAIAVREAADKLAQQWGQKLSELPVRLIEAPDFRLAGAEEVIRQMIASIEQTLQHHEPLARELAGRAVEAHARMHLPLAPPPARSASGGVFGKLLPGSSVNRRLPTPAEMQELLRTYPKTLYQSLLLRHAGNIFLTLRGNLADEMREVNFCRVRLGELLRQLETPPESADPSPEKTVVGQHLFPPGCKNLLEAVEHFESRLGPDALSELDGLMEAMLKKKFTALVTVCLTNANILKNVEMAMLQTAEEYIAGQIGELDVAASFLQHHADSARLNDEVANYFDEARPELLSERRGQGAELCVLATPSGPSGDRLRELTRQAMPEVEWHGAPGDEDILLYRERTNLPLSDLPQLGTLAQDAYRQMSAAEHFTPHSRCDVDFSEG